MDGVTEAKVKTKARPIEAETRPMEAHVTETVAMVDMHDGDGGDADGRRDGDEGGGTAKGRHARRRQGRRPMDGVTTAKTE